MKSAIVVIILLILIGGFVYAYFFYEQPKQQEVIDFCSLSISSRNVDGELVKTYYELHVNNNLYSYGNTSSSGHVLENVPKNSSILIYNKNLDNQSYYIDTLKFNINNESVLRKDIALLEMGGITISKEGRFGRDNPMTIFLNVSGYVKDPVVCLKWSDYIIYSGFDNLTKVENIYNKSYNKCYEFGSDFQDELLEFLLNYKVFNQLHSNDYIALLFVGRDRDPLTNDIINQSLVDFRIEKKLKALNSSLKIS